MNIEQINDLLRFRLKNIAVFSFPTDLSYIDIISPFTRIYLITSGQGTLNIGNERIILEPGFLYIIPSFTSCTYHFGKDVDHYYIHVSIELPNGMNPFSIFSYKFKTPANEFDLQLFKRILEINPDIQLPHLDPCVYQKKVWLNKKVSYDSPGQYLETMGILHQLFSRFLEPGQGNMFTTMLKYNIQPVLEYIHTHLHRDICVETLANIACFSKDHFSRVFKSIISMAPCDYVIQKRIERAQFLLLTTDMGHKEVIDKTGFKSTSYFSRIFKKHTGYSPEQYRKQRG